MDEVRAISAMVVGGIAVNCGERVQVDGDGTVRWVVRAAAGGAEREVRSAAPEVAAFVRELLAARVAVTAGGDQDRATCAACR